MEQQVFSLLQTQDNEVTPISCNSPAVALILSYLEETTQFMLLLPHHKIEYSKECATNRNIHIKLYACLLYKTKDRLGLTIVEQVHNLQDKFNVMLNSIAYLFASPINNRKLKELRVNFRPQFSIQERFVNILSKCRDILNSTMWQTNWIQSSYWDGITLFISIPHVNWSNDSSWS